jgi:hypothetical protein
MGDAGGRIWGFGLRILAPRWVRTLGMALGHHEGNRHNPSGYQHIGESHVIGTRLAKINGGRNRLKNVLI